MQMAQVKKQKDAKKHGEKERDAEVSDHEEEVRLVQAFLPTVIPTVLILTIHHLVAWVLNLIFDPPGAGAAGVVPREQRPGRGAAHGATGGHRRSRVSVSSTTY